MNAIRLSVGVLAMCACTMSCTKIKLKETDAFDIKRTISPEYFKGTECQIETVNIPTEDGLVLNGWHITRDKPRGTVLYFGGNGFVMVTSHHIIRSIVDQNVNLLVFDYRGYGENSGMPTLAGLKKDGLAAYSFLTGARNVDPGNLILHGHSMGSFIASFVAGETKSAGLVLECPMTNVEDWTGRLVPWILKPFVRFDIDPVLLESDNLTRVASLDSPLLILAGTNDKVTPPDMAEALFHAAGTHEKKLVIIDRGGHNDLPTRNEYSDALDSFYRSVFSAPPRNP